MRALSRGLALFELILLAGSGLAVAQTTGEIRGTVVDARGGGLPGATVEVSSPALQGSRSTVTGAGGSFQLSQQFVVINRLQRRSSDGLRAGEQTLMVDRRE